MKMKLYVLAALLSIIFTFSVAFANPASCSGVNDNNAQACGLNSGGTVHTDIAVNSGTNVTSLSALADVSMSTIAAKKATEEKITGYACANCHKKKNAAGQISTANSRTNENKAAANENIYVKSETFIAKNAIGAASSSANIFAGG